MAHRVKELLSFLDSNAHPVAIIWASLPKMRPDLLCILNERWNNFCAGRHRLKELAMRRISAITIIALGVAVVASDAEAKLDLFIDKSVQQIAVLQNGRLLYVWPVSTGLDRFSTPSGVYTPERLERMWFSRAYYNSPMPHAIFFHHGYAIHGSYDITQLGGPASHGCVRLHPQDAAMLFAMVEHEGPGNTTIVVGGGGSPSPAPPRSGDWDDPSRSPPYGREVGLTRGPYPGPQAPPYYNDRYAVGPGPWRGDIGPSPMREPYQTNRPPAPRRDAQAAVEPTPGRRNSYRPPATTAAAAKPNSKCATCSPSRASDELPNRHVSVSDTARLPPAPLLSAPLPPPPPPSPPPPSASSQPALSLPSQPTAPSPAEQQQPSSAYKVLPRSYWAGAAWRWRLKAEHGPLGDSSAAPDSQ